MISPTRGFMVGIAFVFLQRPQGKEEVLTLRKNLVNLYQYMGFIDDQKNHSCQHENSGRLALYTKDLGSIGTTNPLAIDPSL